MRTLSSNALAEIAKTRGIEPINIVDVQWVVNGPFVRYADREVNGMDGKILEVSNLDEIIKVSDNASSTEISITLDDSDGTIKQIIDNNDVHLRTVRIYQWFNGLDLSDAFLLFVGQINSPVTWSESERKFSFNVVSKLEDAEIGFAPEEGFGFDWIADEYFDKPWPLAFGTCLLIPGQLVYKVPQGQTTKPLSMPDTCSQYKMQYEELKEAVDERNVMRSVLLRFNEGTIRQSAFLEKPRTQEELSEFQNQIHAANVAASDNAQQQIDSMRTQLAEQKAQYNSDKSNEINYGTNVGHVINGRRFPQGQFVTIKIEEATFRGFFSGDNFITYDYTNPNEKCGGPITFTSYPAPGEHFTVYDDDGNLQGFGFYNKEEVKTIDDSKYNSSYWFADAGATVEIISDQREIYVANILTSQVRAVYAYKGVENIKQLVALPSSYYKVYHKQINSNYNACFVELHRPLSSYEKEGWSNDGIFITLTSSVGPNTSDILKWMIQTYANGLTADSVSFAAVKTLLTNYPSHFCLFDRKQLLTALQEIAFQARCRIWLDGTVFKISYLATEPDSVDTLTDADIEFGSLSMEYTPTENIITKFNALWKLNYAQTEDNKTTIRYNIGKYGVHEQDYDFYIYNIASLVEKSAVFWSIRLGNTWKLVNLRAFLTKLKIESFDCVTLSLNPNHFSTGDIKGLVQSANYDSENNRIDIQLWLPIVAGQMTKYDFAWPADVAVNLKWPKTTEEFAKSSTAGSNAKGSTLGLGSNQDNTVGGGSGGTTTITHQRYPTGDDNDSFPDNPANGQDTTTSTKAGTQGQAGTVNPIYNTQAVPVPNEFPEEAITTIDIRTTKIRDSERPQLDPGVLINVLRVTEDGRVALWKDAIMSGDDGEGAVPMHFRKHATDDVYRPSGSFLLADDDLDDLETL